MDRITQQAMGFSAARLRRIDDALHRLIDSGTIAGAVTQIARRGQVVQQVAHGLMDVQSAQPMRSDAIFRIASMTKPITAVAVLMLFEEGRFLLDDPIAASIPEFAQTRVFVRQTAAGVETTDLERPITIRHLLTHTSGLTYDFTSNGPVNQLYAQERPLRGNETLEQAMVRLARLPLVCQPGSYWDYSVSIDVLGRLVEVVSGQTLDVFLAQRLFAPLGMADTGFFVPTNQSERLAAVHTVTTEGALQRDSDPRDTRAQRPTLLTGGGGLVSTAHDYGRFCQMLLNGGELDGQRVLGRKTVELLLADQFPQGIRGLPPREGLTALVSLPAGMSQALGGATVAHLGASGFPASAGTYSWTGIYSTGFWVDPQEEMAGIFLCQMLPYTPRWNQLFKVLAYQALDA